ncbi:MAG: SgcJ/EcaC family oxidoreductase [Natronospirillum sp.]
MSQDSLVDAEFEAEILALFDRWNAALASGDPDRVAQKFAAEGVLLPTMSNEMRRDHAGIRDYFEGFMKLKPQGEIEQHYVRRYGDIAINSGTYKFTFGNGDQVRARYTFIYRWDGDRWLIVEQHSSAMPEKD